MEVGKLDAVAGHVKHFKSVQILASSRLLYNPWEVTLYLR